MHSPAETAVVLCLLLEFAVVVATAELADTGPPQTMMRTLACVALIDLVAGFLCTWCLL